MLAKVLSAAVYGIDANLIDVEVDLSGTVSEEDHFHTVGLPDAAVRESRDGGLRAVPGILSIAVLARARGIANLILPAVNAPEAAVVEGVNVFPVASLGDVIELLNSTLLGEVQRVPFRVATEELLGELHHFASDFSDVRGQQTAKRALEVAAAGGHNIL